MTQNVIDSKPDSFGRRLWKARNEAGYSIRKLALELDVAERTVNRWQSDEAAPSVERLAQIARVLGKPPSYFIDQEAA